MICPDCGKFEDKVVETRESKDGKYIRRRRECINCKKRYTTYEKLENIPLLIKKKDGRREEFDIEKIRKGIHRAIEKRSISYKKVERIFIQIEELVSNSENEITTTEIGEFIMKNLKRLDKVAYVRFASVYLDFKSTNEFLTELNNL